MIILIVLNFLGFGLERSCLMGTGKVVDGLVNWENTVRFKNQSTSFTGVHLRS